jgi:MurNAc alpha-1-phosphate uridylyltransferase
MTKLSNAMILAAGRGERMRPLTDTKPKPLLEVAGKPLIVWQLEKLSAAGFKRVVINQGWLGEQLPTALGEGSRWGLEIIYSDETDVPGALETLGGIVKALPLLSPQGEGFAVVNGDVWTDFDYAHLALSKQANLVLVDNPAHNPEGDFDLLGEPLTFSGIAAYSPEMFAGLEAERAPLGPLLRARIAAGEVDAVHHAGRWMDIGTPERLADLEKVLAG